MWKGLSLANSSPFIRCRIDVSRASNRRPCSSLCPDLSHMATCPFRGGKASRTARQEGQGECIVSAHSSCLIHLYLCFVGTLPGSMRNWSGTVWECTLNLLCWMPPFASWFLFVALGEVGYGRGGRWEWKKGKKMKYEYYWKEICIVIKTRMGPKCILQ